MPPEVYHVTNSLGFIQGLFRAYLGLVQGLFRISFRVFRAFTTVFIRSYFEGVLGVSCLMMMLMMMMMLMITTMMLMMMMMKKKKAILVSRCRHPESHTTLALGPPSASTPRLAPIFSHGKVATWPETESFNRVVQDFSTDPMFFLVWLVRLDGVAMMMC